MPNSRICLNLSAFVVLALALSCLPTSEATSEFDGLLKWLRDNNVNLDKVAIKGASPGIQIAESQSRIRPGLVTKTDAKAGDVLLTMPLKLSLTLESLLDISDKSQLLAFVGHLLQSQVDNNNHLAPEMRDSRFLLAMLLLHLTGSTSTGSTPFYEAYIQSLPLAPSSVCFFNKAELEALQAEPESPLLIGRTEQIQAFTKTFQAVKKLVGDQNSEYASLFPRDKLTEKWWRWAYGTVMNRAIIVAGRVPKDAGLFPTDAELAKLFDETAPSVLTQRCDAAGKCESVPSVETQPFVALAMLPFIDLANYGNPPHHNVRVSLVLSPDRKPATPSSDDSVSRSLVDEGVLIQLRAVKDLKAGDELLLAYAGDKFPITNTQLLLQYGFALHKNEYEGVALDIGIDQDAYDQMANIRKYIAEKNDLMTSTIVRLNGSLDPTFVHALRVKELTDQDIRTLQAIDYKFSHTNGYFSLQNEIRVHVQLLSSAESILARYPTSLQADLKTLADWATLASSEPNPSSPLPSTNMQQALAYRIAIKRVLHVMILRSFSDLHTVFDQLVKRWANDIEAHVQQAEQSKDADPDVAQKRTELASWKNQMKTWEGEVESWKRKWQQWVASAVQDRWITLP